MSESYEELVKQLKPLSVIAHRMSGEQFAKHKLIDDPNLIRDETPIACDPVEDNQEIEVEEVFIDIPAESDPNDSVALIDVDESKYTCFFCKCQPLCGYEKAFNHFQLHIDYYPIQCAICDEANTDTKTFINHCRKTHPNVTRVSYHHKPNEPSEKWIASYLKSQSANTYKNSPHPYCPACDWIHLNPDVNSQSGEQKKNSLEILLHIHQHICYVPFNCLKCKDEGIDEFCLSVLDHSVRKHLLEMHGNYYEPPGWKYFGKKYAIPSLDKFINNYLSIFGIKNHKKKIRKRKPKESKVVSSDTDLNQSKSSLVNPIITQNVQQIIVPPQQSNVINGYKPLMPQNQLFLKLLGPNAKLDPNVTVLNKVIPLQWKQSITNEIDSLTTPLLIFPSNTKLNLPAQRVESTNLGVICVDPKLQQLDDKNFKYVCVFCTEQHVTFATKMEACFHYSQHVDYYPIVCLLCESKFIELNELIKHYEETHVNYKDNIFHYLKEDINIEQWIDEFLDLQKTYDFKAQISATYGEYCVACRKLSPPTVDGGMKMKLTLNKDNTKLIRAHIYQHLSYFPYQCTVCYHGDRRVRFSSLNMAATEHLKYWHQAKAFSNTEFERLFAKCSEIVKLEKYIDNDIFGVRENNALNRITVKRKLEEIVEQTKEICAKKLTLTSMLNSPIKPSNFVVNDPKTLKLLLSNNTLVTKPDNGLKSPLKPNSILLKTGKTTAEADSTNNRSSYCQRFLQCFHCHEMVSNTVELESHHQDKHPKLTLASYTPNRDDIRKLLSSKNISNVITIID